jgi:tRNA A-37 threonylcarbamoyl transferase component Bud32
MKISINNTKFDFFENVNNKLYGATSEIYVSTKKEVVIKKVKSYLEYNVYEREKYVLSFLNTMKVDWCPKLLHYDDDDKILIMTYCGDMITLKNKPTTFSKQFTDVMNDLKAFKMKHNDIKENELLVFNNKLYLCDFGWCSINDHLSCGIGLWDGEKPCNYFTDERVYQRLNYLF